MIFFKDGKPLWAFKFLSALVQVAVGFFIFMISITIWALVSDTDYFLIAMIMSGWLSYKMPQWLKIESRLRKKLEANDIDSRTPDSNYVKEPKGITSNANKSSAYSTEEFLAKVSIKDASHSEYMESVPESIPAKKQEFKSGERFVCHDESVTVKKFKLTGPLYLKNTSNDWGERSNYAIDPNRAVKKSNYYDKIGYWADYREMDKAQRYHYLKWLEDGKGATEEMAFVFLYFYGMERYVTHTPNDQDEQLRRKNLVFINNELIRLKKLFSNSRSLIRYANNLQDLIILKYFLKDLDSRKKIFPLGSNLTTTYAVARYANMTPEKIIDSDWALKWLIMSGTIKTTKLLREQYMLIRLLFRELYLASGGICVPQNKKKLRLEYRYCASAESNSQLVEIGPEWCDPSGLKRPLSKLALIYEPLMPIARKISRGLSAKNKIEVLAYWPKSNPDNIPKGLIKTKYRLKELAQGGKLVSIDAVGTLLGMTTTKALTVKERKELGLALETLGLVLVPDVNVTNAKIRKGDTVYLYPGKRLCEYSEEGKQAAVKIRFATTIARADDVIDESETAFIHNIAFNVSSEAEKDYLVGLARWRMITQIDSIGLKNQIEHLNKSQCDELVDISLSIADADGKIDNDERKAITKLLTKCGFSKSEVARKLDERINGVSNSGLEIPTINSSLPLLDATKLQQHQESTVEVQSILGTIFDDEVLEDEPTDENTREKGSDEFWYSEVLDANHQALCAWLMTKESWPKFEVSAKCGSLGLLEDGAVETINEAAYDILGDAIIEPGDPYEIYLDILEN